MAYRILYNPATPGSFMVDNNTGIFVPLAQSRVTPICDTVHSTLELRYSHYDQQPIMSATGYAAISYSNDNGATWTTAGSYTALVAWITQYLFETCGCSGNSVQVTVPLVVTTGSAYAMYQSIGGKITVPIFSKNGGTGRLLSVMITDLSNQKAAMDVYLFSQCTQAYADKVSPQNMYADFPFLLRKISIAASNYSITPNSCAVADIDITAPDLIAATNDKNIYAVIICQGTPSYAVAAALTIKIGAYIE